MTEVERLHIVEANLRAENAELEVENAVMREALGKIAEWADDYGLGDIAKNAISTINAKAEETK